MHVAADLISPGRARPARGLGAGHRLRRARRRGRGRAGRQVPETKHAERIRTALTGPQSGVVLVGRARRRPRGRRRLRRRAPGDPDPRRGRRRRARSATPARCSSGRGRRCRSATTARAPTTCCPPAGAPGTPSGLSVQTFLRGVHVIDYTEEALREAADAVLALSAAEDLPAHGQAISRRFPSRDAFEADRRRTLLRGGGVNPGSRSTSSRCATTCAARPRTARRSSTSPCGSTPTRTPTRRRPSWSPTSPAAVAEVAADLNRYPDRDARRAARRLAAYLTAATGVPLDAGGRVGGQRLQRGPAAGAAGLRRSGTARAGLRAVVLDAPDHRRGHPHRVAPRAAARGLHRRRRRRRRVAAREGARRRVPDQPEQPHRQSLEPADLGSADRGGARHRGGGRGVRRVLRPPQRDRAARAARPQAGRLAHDDQGVRVRRAGGSATWPPRPRSSTRCSSSGCPTTCRRSPRRPRGRRCGTPTPRCGPWRCCGPSGTVW